MWPVSVFLKCTFKSPSFHPSECLCGVVLTVCKKASSLCPTGHSTLLTKGPDKQQGTDRGVRESKGTDGWTKLKERIVRAEQAGGMEKGDSSVVGN